MWVGTEYVNVNVCVCKRGRGPQGVYEISRTVQAGSVDTCVLVCRCMSMRPVSCQTRALHESFRWRLCAHMGNEQDESPTETPLCVHGRGGEAGWGDCGSLETSKDTADARTLTAKASCPAHAGPSLFCSALFCPVQSCVSLCPLLLLPAPPALAITTPITASVAVCSPQPLPVASTPARPRQRATARTRARGARESRIEASLSSPPPPPASAPAAQPCPSLQPWRKRRRRGG